MDKLLLVAAGGGAGAVARYLVGVQAQRSFGPPWPYGTFIVNIAGALAMGLLVAFLAGKAGEGSERLRLLLSVGALGGFTTFSAYSLEVATMIERRALAQAGAYALASVVLCVAAIFIGLMLGKRLFG
jgi:fluoride exporter